MASPHSISKVISRRRGPLGLDTLFWHTLAFGVVATTAVYVVPPTPLYRYGMTLILWSIMLHYGARCRDESRLSDQEVYQAGYEQGRHDELSCLEQMNEQRCKR